MNYQPTEDTDAQGTAWNGLSLDIRGVSKSFGRFPALNDVSLQAKDKEFLALLGPSGSGKTTLLRVLAGLERPDAGEVRFAGVAVASNWFIGGSPSISSIVRNRLVWLYCVLTTAPRLV